MSEVQPLIDLVARHAPWVVTLMTVMGALRLVLKPFNARVQAKLTAMMAAAVLDPVEEATWDQVLHKRWYRLIAFGLDLIFSVKLPTHADLQRLLQAAPAQK